MKAECKCERCTRSYLCKYRDKVEEIAATIKDGIVPVEIGCKFFNSYSWCQTNFASDSTSAKEEK